MFDSHVHLPLSDETLARARAAGVTRFLMAGVQPEDWDAQRALAARHSDLLCAFGLHPQVVAEWTDAACDAAVARLGTECVAIGEIGLDALTPARRATLDRQERVFRAQLAMARERDVPVILHVLRTHDEALRILRKDGLPRAGGVMHSYSGSVDLLAAYLPLGLHISLCGPVTFHNAAKAPAVARVVPLDRLLVETDAPDQTPEPHRPGPNEPAFLRDIVGVIARLRGETFEVVAAATEANARRLFSV